MLKIPSVSLKKYQNIFKFCREIFCLDAGCQRYSIAKYFTVYFCRALKFDARVANLILYYSNVNVLRNDNNVARVKSKRIETSICSIINIKLSTPIFGLPMMQTINF